MDDGTDDHPAVEVVLFIRRQPERFLPTVASVRQALPGVPLLVGAPGGQLDTVRSALEVLGDGAPSVVEAYTAAELVNRVADERRTHVLALDDAVLLPSGMLDRALAEVERDPRVVAVSFLSNAAGYLSFPHHMTPSHHQIEDLDETSLTDRLRERSPEPVMAPVPYAAGAAIMFSESGLLALGPLAGEHASRLEVLAAEYSLRGQARGMTTVMDSGTFYSRPSDLALLDESTFLEPADVAFLVDRHPWAAGVLDPVHEDGAAPRSMAMRVARTKALGLRILIDGTAIGPKEMGTQVQILALTAELADRPDVASVAVGLRGPVPRYAEKVLSHPKIDARACPPNDFTAFGHVDVAHRPFQPDLDLDPMAWRRTAERALVTMQDLIAYQIAAYHASDADWLRLRAAVRRAVAASDGVVVISRDTREQLEREALPVEADRVVVVPNGTDHLTGTEAEALPRELLRRGFSAGDFVLVLGANYGHKNRELAIRTVSELRSRGHQLELVCVGAQVPHGSQRPLETRALLEADRSFGSSRHTVIVPDVLSEERNWLLRHARLVLYPTSAEGFGLVPFEAAAFGTASVSVAFGPVAEVAPDLPVSSRVWDPSDLADACERLLREPALYDAQVEAVRLAGTRYTWRDTAEGLVQAYRSALSRPRRSLATP